MKPKTGILWCNLGTPNEPTTTEVRRYLAQFLSDSRVVEIPRLIWLPILHGLILRLRPKLSAAKYASIWTKEGSPLKVWTEKQAQLLEKTLEQSNHLVKIRFAMRYGQPSISNQLDAFKNDEIDRILILTAYPQYSGTTTASVFDDVMKWSLKQRKIPEFRFVSSYHDDSNYIESLAKSIELHWQQNERSFPLILSFHGVPERTIHLGDSYESECQKTAQLLRNRLNLNENQVKLTFQSRFGKAKWLEPFTQSTLVDLAQNGTKRVDVICPGFTSDCLETLEEINIEARNAFLESGGETFHYIACLNDQAHWILALSEIAKQHLSGWQIKRDKSLSALDI